MSNTYHITVCSLPEYKQLVAEIYLSDQYVGLVSQEAQLEPMMLELSPMGDQRPVKLDLATFEKALAEAKQRLSKLGWASQAK